LRVPVWEKCRTGILRGAVVGVTWFALTYKAQKTFIEFFLIKSPRVTGLSHDSMFGYNIPLSTYATFVFLSSQVTLILRFFLSTNLGSARRIAWDRTVLSRGKGPDFWGPYVEEWQKPPVVDITQSRWKKYLGLYASKWLILRVVLAPLHLYPIIGIVVAAYFRALAMAERLHEPYFKAKKMSPGQTAVFMEERKWDYRSFGFAAALLESLPIIGLLFSVSNRIGAAMWAHDLEKRQHDFASGKLKPIPPVEYTTVGGSTIELEPPKTEGKRREKYAENVEAKDGARVEPPGYYE